MKKFVYLAALVALCAGTVVCAGPASKKPPVVALVASPLYMLTIADSDGVSQSIAVKKTDAFAIETKSGDKTYSVSGDIRPKNGATVTNLRFNRKTVTMVAGRPPAERNELVQTMLTLAPDGKPSLVGKSSTDSNGVKTEYSITASLAPMK